MSDQVPRAAAVLGGEPRVGEVEPFESAATLARELSTDANQCGVAVRGCAGQLEGLSGRSALALREILVDRLLPTAATLELSAHVTERGLRSYSADVRRIHAEAHRVETGVAQNLETIRGCLRVIEEISLAIRFAGDHVWSTAPGPMPEPEIGPVAGQISAWDRATRVHHLRLQHEHEWFHAAVRWRSALDEIEAGRLRWRALIEERGHVEQMLLLALQSTPLGQLLAFQSGGSPAESSTAVAEAFAISGELRGEPSGLAPLSTRHRLLESLVGTRDGSVVWEHPPNAAAVAARWASLGEVERQSLITEVPWVIGNLPGLPFEVRDRANRLTLQHYIAHSAELSTACQQALVQLSRVLFEDESEVSASLVALDLNGLIPLAAVGYGDLDDAQNLVWQVPGMFNDVPRGLPGWHRASANLLRRQTSLLAEAGRTGESAALIVFLEYDTPNLLTVLSPKTAREAAGRLALEIDGTVATREQHSPLPNLGVLAHSYGTTVAANALALIERPVNSFTMIGSAGLDSGRLASLEQLRVERDSARGVPKIYTTMASMDAIAPFGSNLSGRLQPNPQHAESTRRSIGGALGFSSDGDGLLLPTTGHSIVQADGQGYLDIATQSLTNAAALTVGAPELISGELRLMEAWDWNPLQRQRHELAVIGGER